MATLQARAALSRVLVERKGAHKACRACEGPEQGPEQSQSTGHLQDVQSAAPSYPQVLQCNIPGTAIWTMISASLLSNAPLLTNSKLESKV